MASKYFVPELPVTVTQPLSPDDKILHSKRTMPVASSFLGTPTASSSSLPSSFATVLLSATLKPSVTVTFCTHWNLCWKRPLKSARPMEPSLSASAASAIAAHRSTGKETSSREMDSGSFSRYCLKDSFSTGFPLLSSLKRSSTTRSFSCMCSFSTDARIPMLAATRKRSPPSSIKGAHFSWLPLTSASTLAMVAWTSARTFFAVYFCSRSAAAFFALSSSPLAVPSRDWSCARVSFCSWAFLESRDLSARNVLASSTFP
mmetsp:Transcript_45313/g.107819  ORF Transcript_45313/g.107819 Transcript_45313/m.107819 type:complete len:260 (+) Transcript_45313:2000-2779(+)